MSPEKILHTIIAKQTNKQTSKPSGAILSHHTLTSIWNKGTPPEFAISRRSAKAAALAARQAGDPSRPP